MKNINQHSHNPRYNDNIIVKLTFELAVEIIRYSDFLSKEKHYVISNQLSKSGTSVGANVREAQNAESQKDFIHKMKIALKEADETEYWLLVISEVYKHKQCLRLLDQLTSIIKILNKIISSSKQKLNTITESSSN